MHIYVYLTVQHELTISTNGKNFSAIGPVHTHTLHALSFFSWNTGLRELKEIFYVESTEVWDGSSQGG